MVTVLVYVGNGTEDIEGIAQSDSVSADTITEALSHINALWDLLNQNDCMDRDFPTFAKHVLPSKISFISRGDMTDLWRD